MKFEKIKLNQLSLGKPYIRLYAIGKFSLSRGLCEMLDLEDGSPILIIKDEEKAYYIGKAKSSGTETLNVRNYKSTTKNSYTKTFGSAGLKEMLVRDYDLALGAGKKTCVVLDVEKKAVEFEGVNFYKFF